MKKRYLLSALTVVFALAVLCLIAGCSWLEALRGGEGNDPIDSGSTRYLHFVDKDGNGLLDYKVDRDYSDSALSTRLGSIEKNYHVLGGGKYLDGTTFSTVKNELSNYFVNHDPDTWVNNYPAYTVVMELVAITHTLDFYADGQLVQHFELTYEQWGKITPPDVPTKQGYAGKWPQLPYAFEDSRVDAVYTAVTPISSAADWSLMAEHPDAYFQLNADIDFDGGAIPIIEEFNGTLDGLGHKVTNFLILSPSSRERKSTYGLFCVNNGTICNLTIGDGTYKVKSEETIDDKNLGFLTGINNGVISGVEVQGRTLITLTCYNSTDAYPSSSYGYPHEVKSYLSAGVLAGKNSGQIEYSTVSSNVFININTEIFAIRKDDKLLFGGGDSNAEITTHASYGVIAGTNTGRINHVTSSASYLYSNSNLDVTTGFNHANDWAFNFRYYYLHVGGVVGSNEMGGFVRNSFADCVLRPTHSVNARPNPNFTGKSCTVDVGGIAGANSASVEGGAVGSKALLSALCTAETRIGGVVGANDGVVNESYSLAQITAGNTHAQEKSYCGGVVGLSNDKIVNCYAIVTTVELLEGANADNVYFGGLFGYADAKAEITTCFVKLDVEAAVSNSNVFGDYHGLRFNEYCYAFLTDNATGYEPCDKVTVYDTEQEMLASVKKWWYNVVYFTMSETEYPTLPSVGNSK